MQPRPLAGRVSPRLVDALGLKRLFWEEILLCLASRTESSFLLCGVARTLLAEPKVVFDHLTCWLQHAHGGDYVSTAPPRRPTLWAEPMAICDRWICLLQLRACGCDHVLAAPVPLSQTMKGSRFGYDLGHVQVVTHVPSLCCHGQILLTRSSGDSPVLPACATWDHWLACLRHSKPHWIPIAAEVAASGVHKETWHGTGRTVHLGERGSSQECGPSFLSQPVQTSAVRWLVSLIAKTSPTEASTPAMAWRMLVEAVAEDMDEGSDPGEAQCR